MSNNLLKSDPGTIEKLQPWGQTFASERYNNEEPALMLKLFDLNAKKRYCSVLRSHKNASGTFYLTIP